MLGRGGHICKNGQRNVGTIELCFKSKYACKICNPFGKKFTHFTYYQSYEKSVTFCVFPDNQEELRLQIVKLSAFYSISEGLDCL